MKSFRERVVEVVQAIPAGQVRTYGAVAAAAGNPRAARAVGAIMRANQCSFLTHAGRPEAVPCHRVIAAHESLGGFNGGSSVKIALLQQEGWTVLDSRLYATNDTHHH